MLVATVVEHRYCSSCSRHGRYTVGLLKKSYHERVIPMDMFAMNKKYGQGDQTWDFSWGVKIILQEACTLRKIEI